FIWLLVFGSDGLLARYEQFDTDRPADALARFDELTAEPAAVRFAAAPSRVAERVERRVRANAASANAARLEAAIATRDPDALPTLLAERAEVVDHPTGATYDRRGLLTTWRLMLSAQDLTFRQELLATLGDSLALYRTSMSASGFTDGKVDVGVFERDDIVLREVDAQGVIRRTEIFALDHLSDAVARLYTRYAELLPDGPARDRAAPTARAIATALMRGPLDLEWWATAFSPSLEHVD